MCYVWLPISKTQIHEFQLNAPCDQRQISVVVVGFFFPFPRDLLFNQIYSRLVENSVAKGVFLESLEPYILSERIGCLTAPVMRDLLSYFQENGMMESVEGCLVHMDITNLDIQQVGLASGFPTECLGV